VSYTPSTRRLLDGVVASRVALRTGPETKAKLCGLNEEKRKAAEGVPEWLIVTCASAPV
jgi:hypothetical protein